MASEPVAFGDHSPAPPVHVAIIMDGNGRWAAARKLPRTAGHKKGAERVREVIQAAVEAGVQVLTLFGFSVENWSRPEAEVRDLMGLLRLYLDNHMRELVDNGIRLRVIGDRGRLPADVVESIEKAERESVASTRLTLCIALSYGGRQDIVDAARAVARQAAGGDIDPEAINEDVFGSALATAGLPDPDLVIRTSGELRVSNFLLWQMAYSEFVFSQVLWPDFDATAFNTALSEFADRERRFGGVEQV